eukprot:GABV01008612.1.p1 GENE.GABV01008612.1~~GABV01008612.1.p1  ORF type:complete len:223 (+),score=66.27 GABV01008612.1:434-1102(+)
MASMRLAKAVQLNLLSRQATKAPNSCNLWRLPLTSEAATPADQAKSALARARKEVTGTSSSAASAKKASSTTATAVSAAARRAARQLRPARRMEVDAWHRAPGYEQPQSATEEEFDNASIRPILDGPSQKVIALWLVTREPLDWRRVECTITVTHVQPSAGPAAPTSKHTSRPTLTRLLRRMVRRCCFWPILLVIGCISHVDEFDIQIETSWFAHFGSWWWW